MATHTVPAVDLFPDRPMSRYECYSQQYQRGVGKPFTQAERNAIFGKDRVKATFPNKPDPEWLAHPDWPIIAYHADGSIKRTSAEIALAPATTPDDVVAAPDPEPAPESQPSPQDPPAPRVRVNDAGCPRCGTVPEPQDRFCGECGLLLTVFRDAPAPDVQTPDDLDGIVGHWPGYIPIAAKYRGKNPERILDQRPDATDVRGFHDWLKSGRVVKKGEKGVLIYVPIRAGESIDAETGDADDRRPRVKKAYVFDIAQTDVLTPKDASGITPPARSVPPLTVVPAPPANVTPFRRPEPAPALRAADI